MLKIPLLVSLGHHGGRRKVASLRPPFSTPLRSLGEPDPDTPFLVPIEHAPPLFVRIREDKISLKIYPAPLVSSQTRPTARTESSDPCSTVTEPASFPPLSLRVEWTFPSRPLKNGSTNQKIKPNRERYKKKIPK